MRDKPESLREAVEAVLVETGAVRRQLSLKSTFINLWDYQAVEEAHHRLSCMRKKGEIDATLDEVAQAMTEVMKNAIE